MNLTELQHKLIAAARSTPANDAVPYAFEQRILARLRAVTPDPWTLWAAMLWRAAAPCVAVMLLLSAWTFLQNGGNGAESLASALENTVLAALYEPGDTW